MSKLSQGTIGCQITGDGITAYNYFAQGVPVQNTNAPSGGSTPVILQVGNNTLTPPTTNTKGVIISPPTTSINGKTLKGVNGDTGIQLATNAPIMLYLNAPGAAAFVLNSAGIETVDVTWL